MAVTGLAQAQSANKRGRDQRKGSSVRGIWCTLNRPDRTGRPVDTPQPKGMLIYTRDGHMSVQLMYPKVGKRSIQ